MKRLRDLLVNIGISLATFLLCLIVAEIVFSLLGYGNVEVYQYDPEVFWKLKPNQDCVTKVNRLPVHINARGTRGPEFEVPKPDGVYRILAVGDSRTFGWGLKESDTYEGKLQEMLQSAAKPGQRIEVINSGTNAWGYDQFYSFLRTYGLGYQPDLVIIGDGNQWTQFSDDSSPQFRNQFKYRVILKNLLRRSALYNYVVEYQLRQFYETYRLKFVPMDPHKDTLFKEQQKANPYDHFEEALRKSCLLVRGRGTQVLLLHIPDSNELGASGVPREIEKAFEKVSSELSVPLVDVTPEFKASKKDLYLEGDSVHPNILGDDLIARQLANEILYLNLLNK